MVIRYDRFTEQRFDNRCSEFVSDFEKSYTTCGDWIMLGELKPLEAKNGEPAA